MSHLSSTANWTADELPVGTSIAGFVVERVLGHGGAAVVYACHDPQLDRKVAVKVMKPESAGDEAAARFDRERKAVAKVKSPHVVDVYAAGECEHGRYLVMQLLDGDSLAKRLKDKGRLAIADAVAIALDVARGLRDAAAAGIVHRDVKPRNIILTSSGAVLTDFGLARPVVQGSAAVTSAGIVMGTPHYLAPEVIRGDPPTNASDAYSLGAVLYEMLAGAPPFDMPSNAEVMAAQLQGEVPALKSKREEVPQNLAQLVHRLLGKSATSRLHNFDEIIGELMTVHASSHDAAISDGEKIPSLTDLSALQSIPSLPEIPSLSDLPSIPNLSDLAPDAETRAKVLDETLPANDITHPPPPTKDSWVDAALPKIEATAGPTPEVTDTNLSSDNLPMATGAVRIDSAASLPMATGAVPIDSAASLPMVSGAVPIQSRTLKPDVAQLLAKAKTALAPVIPLARKGAERARAASDVVLARVRTAPPPLRFGAGIAIAAILGFVVVAMLLQEDDLDRINKGDASAVLKENDAIPADERTANDELIRGHALFALGKRDDAFKAWTLAADRGSVDNAMKAAAFTRLDEEKPEPALTLLRAWPDASIDKELRAMTSADRFWRRHWALTLLEDRKATDGVDIEGVAIAILGDGETCAQRKLGVDRLMKHGRTPAAVDAVERARKAKGNGCMRAELKAAEAAIKARDPSR